MAKLSRTALKGIVKECLMEILSEGLGNESSGLNESVSRKSRPKRRAAPKPSHRSSVDTVSFKTAVNNTVSKVTDDPIMSAILSDTAATTLQEQLTAGETPSAPTASEEGVPLAGLTDDIFGEASQNWADLAFSD
tara:strand:+ start:303 stop:707 length:405 start_codon:yes stop_codon:yes gene_type:complete